MTWTYPKTWVTGELVTAATLNTHVRDNLAHLKNNLKVTSTSFTLPSDYTLNVLDDDSGWVYTDTTNLKHTFVLDEDKTVILLATARVSESLANTATGDYAAFTLRAELRERGDRGRFRRLHRAESLQRGLEWVQPDEANSCGEPGIRNPHRLFAVAVEHQRRLCNDHLRGGSGGVHRD